VPITGSFDAKVAVETTKQLATVSSLRSGLEVKNQRRVKIEAKSGSQVKPEGQVAHMSQVRLTY
jgi:hypothetical protein